MGTAARHPSREFIMNTTPKGKIGRLPKAVQETLNRRLQDGEPGKVLVAWLNELEPVQAMVKEHFNGQPIVEQNLSEWRKRGYQQWLWREEAKEMAVEMAEESTELQASGMHSFTDQMSSWVTVRYLMAVRKLIEATQDKEPDLKMLRNFLQDVVLVRRGDLSHARVKLHQERLDREQEKTEAELIAYFQQWVEFPAVQDLIRNQGLNRQERQKRLAELCQRKAEPQSEPDGQMGKNE